MKVVFMTPSKLSAILSRKGRKVALFVLSGLCATIALPVLAQDYAERARYCVQLEQELAQVWVQGNQPNVDLPRIREEIQKNDRIFQGAQAKAERANCYEYAFIFGKTLRRTKRCLALNKKIEEARRNLSRLNSQREAMTNSGARQGRRQELISELARNRCGPQYQRETRKRSNNFFEDIFGGNNNYYEPQPRFEGRQNLEILPYATYRTMCVRKCDGYYFPVSYSTLSSKFAGDADQCASNCAAPAELFIYRNPGEEVEHMISLSGEPYSDLPNAWRYRKEFVKGCSCNQAEYSPTPGGGVGNGLGKTPNNSDEPQKTGKWQGAVDPQAQVSPDVSAPSAKPSAR